MNCATRIRENGIGVLWCTSTTAYKVYCLWAIKFQCEVSRGIFCLQEGRKLTLSLKMMRAWRGPQLFLLLRPVVLLSLALYVVGVILFAAQSQTNAIFRWQLYRPQHSLASNVPGKKATEGIDHDHTYRTATNNVASPGVTSRVLEWSRSSKVVAPVLAVGCFSGEQLTRGALQLADLLNLSQGLRRSVVLPSVFGGYLVSMAGLCHIRPTYYKAGVEMERLSAYFDLKSPSNVVKPNGVDLFINEAQAQKRCVGRWTVLNLVSNYIAQEAVCKTNRSLMEKETAMIEQLRLATRIEDAIDTNCEWLEGCLKDSLKRLGPFRRIICAAVPKHLEGVWTISDLVSHLAGLESSDECLLMPTWVGGERYGIRPIAPASVPYLAATSFGPARNLVQISQRVIRASGLANTYTVIHVRTEHLFRHFLPHHPGHLHHGGPAFIEFCLPCFERLSVMLQQVKPSSSTVLVAFDNKSGSVKKGLGSSIEDLRAILLKNLKKFFKVIRLLDDVVDGYSSKHDKQVMANPGLRAVVDTELIVSGEWLFVMGGGSFQGKLFAMHEERNENIANEARTFAVCHPSIAWNVVLLAKRLPFLPKGVLESSYDERIMKEFPFRGIKEKDTYQVVHEKRKLNSTSGH
eukprot:scpid66525/ scgid33421/ 